MQTQHTSPTRRVMATTLLVVLMCSLSTASFAQSPQGAAPTAFEKGTYLVRTTDGAELRGQLERMDHDSLRLRVGTEPRDLPMDRVDLVQRHGDSVGNGAAIGALIGGIAGGAMVAAWGAGGGEVVGAAAVDAAFAGLIGAGIDKLISSNHTLYQRPRLALAPTRGGVAVSYRLPLGGH